MTSEAILGLVIQTAALLVTILGILIPYLSDQRRKQAEALANALDAIRDELEEDRRRHEKEMGELKASLLCERQDRVDKTARLHERIDDMQQKMISELQDRIAGMEGEFKGMSNILNKIHEWFIRQAGKDGGS